MPRIFISYANEDEALARAVCTFLERHDVTCWLAKRDNQPGRSYAEAIIQAIDRADGVVLVLSERAGGAPFVQREIERAGSKNKPIFSLKVDDAEPAAGLELFVGPTHWVDARQAPVEEHLPKLLAAIAAAFAMPGALALASADRRRPVAEWQPDHGDPRIAEYRPGERLVGTTVRPVRRGARWPRIAGLVVLLLAIIAAGIWFSLPDRRLVLENASITPVAAIYVTPSAGPGPSEDLLGHSEPFRGGMVGTLSLPGLGWTCAYDVRFADARYVPGQPDAGQRPHFVSYPNLDLCADPPPRITLASRRFIVANESQFSIFYVWAAPYTDTTWGDEMLGRERTFPLDMEATFYVEGFARECDFEVKIADERYDPTKDEQGQEATFVSYRHVDVCADPPPRIIYRRQPLPVATQ